MSSSSRVLGIVVCSLSLSLASCGSSSGTPQSTEASGAGGSIPAGGVGGLNGLPASGGVSGSVGGAGTNGISAGAGGATAPGGRAGAAGNGQAPGSGGVTSSGGTAQSGSGGVAIGGAGGSGGAGTSGSSGSAGGDTKGPCDIYASGNTPCVAAHSTVRALYGAYAGNLYQVRRASDKTTKAISVLTPGGFADSGAQDTFCKSTTCTISIIYDQSPKGNHLTSAPAGGAKKTPDDEASATGQKLMVAGHTVYAVYINAGMGYRNDKTSGVATADQPEGEYMVTAGKHFNGGCCFDYGNAETSNNDDGNGTMEAIYFGNNTGWGKGSGNGPWVMADLENGLFAGGNTGLYSGNMTVSTDYVTAIIKGEPNHWAIRVGNAQSGNLTTMWDGKRPSGGYNPMRKQGAIILGIGGDNSNGAIGTFFEGCMTSGYPSNETEDAIQANIVAAGYGK